MDRNNYTSEVKSSIVNVKKWTNEILDIDSTLLNGSVKILSSKSNVLEQFGSPIKTIEHRPSEYLSYMLNENIDSKVYSLVYENMKFDGVGNKVIFNKMFFEDDNFIIAQNLILKKGFHVRDLCINYPESCKLTILGGNAWSGHIELRVSRKAAYEDLRWFLIFKGELLESIELHRFL